MRGKFAKCRAHKRLRYSGDMADTTKVRLARERAGLCADCLHARGIESSRGSVFLLCELSKSDAHFTKYPRLPVLSCPGYEKNVKQPDNA